MCIRDSSKTINTFLKEHREQRIPKMTKSEPIPQGDESSLRKLVALNFENIVLKARDNVIVLFCSGEDHPCKRPLQVFRDLDGILRKSNKKDVLRIFSMDISLNEVPSLSIESFPDVRLYLRNYKNRPKKYSGRIRLDRLVEWLDSVIPELSLSNDGNLKAAIEASNSQKTEL
eukprot:TRINITY_DN15867_c0_g1_i2.p1 TRINITY_DN15867_c0_g1~~TRINITY_DN15867_c0_g1_i2.p1  ORF type:complete len:173 (+),score=23.53 TRINITY_DN15867_c0_g1_i2:60-578(+)